MRTLFQIILILFTIASLYIVRGDLMTTYDKGKELIVDTFPSTSKYISVNTENSEKKELKAQSNSKEESVSILGLKKLIDTPGALRVSDSVLSSFKESKLTRPGVIEWTNKNRKEVANLKPLIENTKLDVSAEKKLQDMFDKQYFEHVSPSGVGVSDLGEQVGYEFIIIGENLALGNFKNDEAVVTAWMNSPGHRANILNKRYTEIGIAVGKGMFEGKETWLAVQHFGLPRSSCPNIDGVLKGVISLSQTRITTLQSQLGKMKGDIDKGIIVDNKTHNEQIDAYNKLVQVYNDLINETKKSVEKYNAQVRAFNECVQATE